jgi:hypothetical protein
VALTAHLDHVVARFRGGELVVVLDNVAERCTCALGGFAARERRRIPTEA